jgi:hypothetical protein
MLSCPLSAGIPSPQAREMRCGDVRDPRPPAHREKWGCGCGVWAYALCGSIEKTDGRASPTTPRQTDRQDGKCRRQSGEVMRHPITEYDMAENGIP